MEEGIVVEWTADVGEPFDEGGIIAVVESEKTTNDVKARESGRILEQFVGLEEPVEPGDPIAYVGQEGESVPDDVGAEAATDTASPGEEQSEPVAPETGATGTSTTASSTDDAKVSPRARSYAREHDIEREQLAELSGTGPDGAVVEGDVVEAVEGGLLGSADAAAGGSDAVTGAGKPAAGAGESASVSGRDVYETRGESGLRRTIAERMTESARAPQVTLNRRAPVDRLLSVKEQLERERGLELSVTDFLLVALVDALQEHPGLNGIYEDGVHKLARNVNVGVAVDIEDGLVTPVIEGADRRTITELRAERQRLVSLVQSGEFTMDDLSGGTVTVTNLGHFGVESFDPILNPPQVAVLGVGTVQSRYDPETEESVRELGLSLTFDHRAVDGADAARFLQTLVDALSRPLALISFGREAPTDDGAGGPFLDTDAGPAGDRTATASSDGGMQATVRSRGFEWRADEPDDQGGMDTAPNPVEQFVGSLSSCLTLMIGHMADRRDVDVDDVEVTAQASPSEGRIERIDLDVRVVSADGDNQVEQVVDMAERACYVNQVVDSDLERSITVTVEQS